MRCCKLLDFSIQMLEHNRIICFIQGGVRFEDNAFPTIRELLNYHTIHNAPVTKKSGAMLTTAIQRPDLKPAKDKWSISHSRISIQTKLGQGHFGDVMKGILLPENLPVAVKSCKENVSDVVKQKFLAEAAILKQYEHPNIVKLIGICADREPVYIGRYTHFSLFNNIMKCKTF